MQMRKTNHSYRSNQSNNNSKIIQKRMKMKQKQNDSIDENDHEMESDDGRLNHDIGLGSFDENTTDPTDIMEQHMKKIKSKNSMNMSSGDEQSQEESDYDEQEDDWYEEGKNDNGKKP